MTTIYFLCLWVNSSNENLFLKNSNTHHKAVGLNLHIYIYVQSIVYVPFHITGFTITFISVSQHFASHFIVAVVVSCGKLKTTEYLRHIDIADWLHSIQILLICSHSKICPNPSVMMPAAWCRILLALHIFKPDILLPLPLHQWHCILNICIWTGTIKTLHQ